MNQQQKNHLKARIRELVEESLAGLREIEHLDAEEKFELGLKEKYLRWPTFSELKDRITDVITSSRSYITDVGRALFGEPFWNAWHIEIERRKKEETQKRDRVKRDIKRLQDETLDVIMLGDSEDATNALKIFEGKLNALAKAWNEAA